MSAKIDTHLISKISPISCRGIRVSQEKHVIHTQAQREERKYLVESKVSNYDPDVREAFGFLSEYFRVNDKYILG